MVYMSQTRVKVVKYYTYIFDFELLPSGCRYRAPAQRTKIYKVSFVCTANTQPEFAHDLCTSASNVFSI